MSAAGPSGRAHLFAVEGRLVSVEPLGGGHIHETFLGAATGPEDSTAGLVDADIATAVVDGNVAAVPDLLTDGERSTLPVAGPLMAFEAALRFLTDHLAGDVCFRVARPGHNLDRARAQLGLVDCLRATAARRQ